MKQNPQITKGDNYNVTMQIGNLALRVTWFKDCKALSKKIESIENEKIIRLWPFEKNSKVSERNSFDDIDSFQLSVVLKSD